jgi:hypothetical protein
MHVNLVFAVPAATAAFPLVSNVAVLIERRSDHSLLPLSVVTARNRGGSYLAIGLGRRACSGSFCS